jgi:succinyl-CoA synthetase beta subunit
VILFEFEGKHILSEDGIEVPKSVLITSEGQEIPLKFPIFLKAQVLSGKRKDAGGIILVNDIKELKNEVRNLFLKTINGEAVTSILAEEKLDFDKEYYLSVSYNTDLRSPVISFSETGGSGIEDRGFKIIPVDPITLDFDKKELPEVIQNFIPNLLKSFFDNDCLLLEINPLVVSKGKLVALDAKVNLDDTAFGRHKERTFPPRSAPGHTPTQNEIDAKKIDENDYRGTAGSAYFDFDGDIAILASGGGASLTAMDALLAAGGSPANYTEYSGNPPKEKVEKLTQIVLSKKGLHGLWVVGAVANFTDIYETLSGFLEALRKIDPRPKFPIVIRRGGPNDKKAFEMLKTVKDFDFHLYGQETSITKSAKIMAGLAKRYAVTT